MWTIYAAPTDFPNVPYLVRGWAILPGGELMATGAMAFADTLAQARGVIPVGLVQMERSLDDDPVIVETWL
jgi:hypothetical protein